MPNLWMSIDLTGARGKVPWTAVRSYIRRSRARLTHATVKNLSSVSTHKTLEILSRCPRLEYLELWITHDYKDFYERFKGCKQLKTLILSADMPISHEYFAKLVVTLPQLERIALWNTKRTRMQIPDNAWPNSLPNLKSLTLGGVLDAPSIHVPSLGTVRKC